MTAKEELSQYKYARDKVEETLEEYEKYQTRATKMTSIISDMPRNSQRSDKIADNASIMADLSRQYEERWRNAEKERLRIEEKIDMVKEPYRTILHLRWVEGKTLEEISCKLNCNYTYACEIHGYALKEYEKINYPS